MRRAALLLAAVVVAALGMAGAWPETARSAPETACKSGALHCLYPYEETPVLLNTINDSGAPCTITFKVNWGDGAVDVATVPPSSSQVLFHEYAKPGLYTITRDGTVQPGSHELCDGYVWDNEFSVEVVPPVLKITELTLNDIDNKPLEYLSTDDHTYFEGKTRIHGTITIKGRPKHELESLVLEVKGKDGTLAKAKVAKGVKDTLFANFGSDEKVSVGKSKLLFVLPSAQADLLDSEENGDVELKVVAKTKPTFKLDSMKTVRTFGSVPKLVRYDAPNRYGTGRDENRGGDDWVKPSVRTVAKHFSTNNWNDFSNMNGGSFAPDHASHRTGIDIDGKFAGYDARDQAVAQTIIGHLNDDTYGSRIRIVYVTFNAPGKPPLECEKGMGVDTNHSAFWKAIQDVKLDDGRQASNVIQPKKGHCIHFHWRVSD